MIAPALAALVAVFVCGVWASWIAPLDRHNTVFWLGLLLGPVGVIGAAVAQPRPGKPRAIAEGRKRYRCARCGADSDLHEPKDFSCWRCGEKKYMAAK